MSTLYGNTLALQKAINTNEELVAGELFTLVTWKQQPDAHWFGANIPGDLQSVEVVKTNSNGNAVAIDYQRYEGNNLVLNSDTLHKSQRIKFMIDQRPSVMP
jgi:outer membrane usher protein FimD/PapC